MSSVKRHSGDAVAQRAPAAHASRAAHFAAVRRQTESLAAPLSPEDCALQSMPDASPVKWHLAHVSWFFETFVLVPHASRYRPFDAAFRVLFNSYYDGVGDKHPRAERGLLSRPDLATVLAYRRHVDAAMQRCLERPLPKEAAALVELGLHHEQQHQELLLTDVKHLFSRNPARPVYHPRWPLAPVAPRPHAWHRYEGGLVSLGHAGTGFAFDNEGPAHRVFVAPFELASAPVTHGEFAAFIADGGYERPELWLAQGWDVATTRGWQAPLYWEREGAQWRTFTLHGMADVDPHTPVCHVSLFEADAYARWAGARLPTEFEWEHAARAAPIAGNFLETGALHPLPRAGDAPAAGPGQLFGDVWEWTRSDYAPYPGYRPAAGAVGEYNGKFMSNQYVLRGGSCATPASHVRATYRNFFPADARWQFSGLRLARDQAA
jgi:ergothioneine biosynthesis protein EgtB